MILDVIVTFPKLYLWETSISQLAVNIKTKNVIILYLILVIIRVLTYIFLILCPGLKLKDPCFSSEYLKMSQGTHPFFWNYWLVSCCSNRSENPKLLLRYKFLVQRTYLFMISYLVHVFMMLNTGSLNVR